MVPRGRLYPLILLHTTVCLILLAAVWGAIDLALRAERESNLRVTEALATTLAGVTEQHLLSALTDIDRTSLALRRAYIRDPANFDRFLNDGDVPQAIFPTFQVSVINAAGFLAYSSGPPSVGPVDLRDRLHFRYHLTAPGDDLYISRVVVGRVSNALSLQFTRKIVNQAGVFQGVLVLSVEHSYFTQFLKTVALPPDGLVALIGLDGWVRARVTSADLSDGAVPLTVFETPLQDTPFLDPARPTLGTYQMQDTLDGVGRLGAYRRLSAYPLVALVLVSDERIEEMGRAVRGPLLGGGLVLSLLVVGAGGVGLREVLRREATITAMIQREAQLRDLANSDVLTGIANRRYFLDRAGVEIGRALRHRRPMALAMLDLDHFKRVNDQFGHAGGDAVLQELVRRIRARLRREDLIGRLGGEEFAILLPETEIEGALKALDLIRDLIAETPFHLPDGRLVVVTASIGVADLRPDSGFVPDTLEQLLKRADDALYAAKRGGRNRVILDVGPSPFAVAAAQKSDSSGA
ncbi:MAG: sensor domain-containing diguanylate cyclase [Elstera sp.]